MHALVLGALLAIDPLHSSAQFSVEHIFVERVAGTVPILRGSIDVRDGSRVPLRVSAQLDAAHLQTGDPDRDASLRSPDWFDTNDFPAWSFESTKIVPAADGFVMAGALTIHGVAQTENVNVVVSGTTARPHYTGTCRVDRHAFGMKIDRLDPVIGNTVEVTLDIAVK